MERIDREDTKNRYAGKKTGSFRSPKRDGRRDDKNRSYGNETRYIEGRNPVTEMIRAGKSIDKIYVAKDTAGSIGGILKMAREQKIPVVQCDRRKLDLLSHTGAHQGIMAAVAEIQYSEMSDLYKKADERKQPLLVLICDGITDPQNLGAIIRTAEVTGAHGIIIPKRRSAGINAACLKAAAGALAYIPVVRVSNLVSVINELKEHGVFVYGTDIHADKDLFEESFEGPTALVIGSEGEGMSQLVKKNCDVLLRIPMQGNISSLNASVAAAVTLYEVYRKRSF